MIITTRITIESKDDNVPDASVAIWGDFIDGSLDDWNTDVPTELSPSDCELCVDKLYEVYND